jgi:hypothetical protein
MCLICGNIGCGRYAEAHAYKSVNKLEKNNLYRRNNLGIMRRRHTFLPFKLEVNWFGIMLATTMFID